MKGDALNGTWIMFTTPEGGRAEVRLPAEATVRDVELAQAILTVIKDHLLAAADVAATQDESSR